MTSDASGQVFPPINTGWDSDDIDDLVANTSFDSGNLGIDVATGDSFTYATAITGDRGFVKLGAGALTLSGANTYTGDTTIDGGALTVGSDHALPSRVKFRSSDSMKERSSWCYTRCSSCFYSPIAQTGGPRDVIPWNRPASQAVDRECPQ